MLTIYKASAGSGKTYTLAYEYIRSLLGIKKKETGRCRLNHQAYGNAQQNRHRYILAITFTNKATEEMKKRIVDELKALSVMPPDPTPGKPQPNDANYAQKLCDVFACTRRHLAEAANIALRDLLCDYGNFNITTIDSFFQRVLRTFARELDRPGDFNVELDNDMAVHGAVSTMLDDFNNDPDNHSQLGDWIYNYVTSLIDTGEKSNFFNRSARIYTTLVGAVSQISNEEFKPYAEDMRHYLLDDDGKRLAKLAAAIKEYRDGMLERVREYALSRWQALNDDGITLADFNGTQKVTKNIEEVLCRGVLAKSGKDNFLFGAAAEKIANGNTSGLIKKNFKGTQAHIDTVCDIVIYARSQYLLYYYCDLLLEALSGLTLLAYSWRYLDNFVSENNLVLLSDTNHLLERIIGADETPFIYERLGVQLRNFLIDEFQDTSRMQWKNLKPLVENGMAQQEDSLIIGDEKQSIYRFRNSDAQLLHSEIEEKDFPATDYAIDIRGREPADNTNHRSSRDIVTFNNSLFASWAAVKGIDGYQNVVQQVSSKNIDRPGYVHLIPFSNEEYSEESPMLEALGREITRQHNEGGYPWSDIAVLVPKTKHAARIIDFLAARYPDIPLLSDDARYLYRSPAVQLVVGILRVIADVPRRDEEKTGGKKNYPSRPEVKAMTGRYNYLIKEGIEPQQAIDMVMTADTQKLRKDLCESIEMIKRRKPSTIAALVETIIHEQLSAGMRQSQYAYLTAFLDYVVDYTSRYRPTLKAFINNWDNNGSKLAIPGAAKVNAVRVMTIHKSKGLEFECVHLPFGSYKKSNKATYRWIPFVGLPGIDEKLYPPAVYVKLSDKLFERDGSPISGNCRAESKGIETDVLNRTYVAYTRAGTELTVYYNPGKDIGKEVVDAIKRAGAPATGSDATIDLRAGFNPETCEYVLGEPTKAKATEAKADDNAGMLGKEYPVYFHDGADVLTRLDDALDLDRDISDNDVDERPDAIAALIHDNEENARRRGVLMHLALSMIKTFGDIDRAVDIITVERGLSQQQMVELADGLSAMLDNANGDVRRWFGGNGRVLTEQPVYVSDKDEERRLDRVVFNPDGSVDVIDYKFTAATDDKHQLQVRQYMSLLREMGYGTVHGYLWYPFLKNKIMEVK